MPEHKFSAVILAGGQSQRMGRDKAMVQWKGRALLARALSMAAGAGATEIFISGRKGVDYSLPDIPVLLDLKPGIGPLGGIERALATTHSPLVLVLAVDMPQITAAFLRKLVKHCTDNTGVVPAAGENLEALTAVYPKSSHALSVKMLRKKQFAARGFAQACLQAGLVQRYEYTPRERVQFANCNSPSDLRNLKKHHPAPFSLARRRKLTTLTAP
jgi:molybdopterin-guanine dinucleotide biosynthesis protein A